MKRVPLLIGLLVCAVCCPILHATEFDDAKSKAEKFLSRYEEIRSLHPKQIRALVEITCGSDGDKDDFDSLSRQATEKLRDDVRENIEDLNKLHEDASNALRRVESNPEFKEKQSEARSQSERIDQIWMRIQNIYADEIRGGNNPVVAYMRKMGQESHKDYQDHSGKCTRAVRIHSRHDPSVAANRVPATPQSARRLHLGRGCS
jgi:seryl-tRNA synthetase